MRRDLRARVPATLRVSVARSRDIRTNQSDLACDICGRTLLRGEQPETFLAGGSRRQVCDLCTARAQHEGWIRESGGDELELRHTRHDGRGRSFVERLRARRERARESQDEMPPRPTTRRVHEEPDARARRARAAPRRPRHVRAVPTNADLKMQRALEVFNSSDHTRTVGGVARSLARPACRVRPRTDRPSVVVDHRDVGAQLVPLRDRPVRRGGGVRRDAQGDELSELRRRSRTSTQPRTSVARCISHMTDDRCKSPYCFVSVRRVIYCVVPEPLADELYEKLAKYYEDDPNVEVIVDRRKSERRDTGHRRRSARGARPAASPGRRRLPAAVRGVGPRGSSSSTWTAARAAIPGPPLRRPSCPTPDGDVLDETAVALGRATNNVAEYRGLLLGLDRARALGATEVDVVNDSELVAKQVNGEYKVKSPELVELHRAGAATRSRASSAGRSSRSRARRTPPPTRSSTGRSTATATPAGDRLRGLSAHRRPAAAPASAHARARTTSCCS